MNGYSSEGLPSMIGDPATYSNWNLSVLGVNWNKNFAGTETQKPLRDLQYLLRKPSFYHFYGFCLDDQQMWGFFEICCQNVNYFHGSRTDSKSMILRCHEICQQSWHFHSIINTLNLKSFSMSVTDNSSWPLKSTIVNTNWQQFLSMLMSIWKFNIKCQKATISHVWRPVSFIILGSDQPGCLKEVHIKRKLQFHIVPRAL